jgi:HlyD family secretion protein
VHTGDLLVELDTTELVAALNEARANVASAEAALATTRAGLADAQNREERATALHDRNLQSTAEFEAATSTLSRSQAEMRGARARLELARASLERAQANLDNARIVAPIDGIVLVRSIEPGQTVAAAFQAPVLFRIAEDLTRMELNVDVDEADVGRVREGQSATFTVDAYADRTFDATITRLAFASHLSERVVVYEAVLAVENPDLALRPGMTATASIETGREENVLVVPNRALRFRPPPDGPFGGPRAPPPPGPTVYTLENGAPKAISVEIGATDGERTEISGEGIDDGLEVLVGLAQEAP